jgi:hypothetical protein
MAKNVKKFVNRDFAKTVDLDLLKRLIDPYAVDDPTRLECTAC